MSIVQKKVLWKSEIGSNNTQSVFENLLSELNESSQYFNQVLLNQFRFNKVKEQNIVGILSFDEYHRNISQINYALLQIIDDINLEDIKQVEEIKVSEVDFKEVQNFLNGWADSIGSDYTREKIENTHHGKITYTSTKRSRISEFFCYSSGEVKFHLHLVDESKVDDENPHRDSGIQRFEKFHSVEMNLKNLSKIELIADSENSDKGLGKLIFQSKNRRNHIRWEEYATYYREDFRPTPKQIKEAKKTDFTYNDDKLEIMVKMNDITLRFKNALEYAWKFVGGKPDIF